MMENNMQIPDQYLADISRLFEIQKAPSALLKVLVNKAFEGRILIDKLNRIELCSKLKIERQTLANYLNILCKKGILKRVRRNDYCLNPKLFSRTDRPFTQISIDYIDGERDVWGS